MGEAASLRPEHTSCSSQRARRQGFITATGDFQAAKASFFDKKLLFVGDGIALFRSHIAQSTDQAATDCLSSEKVLGGDVDMLKWEKKLVQYAHLRRLRSNAVGTKHLAGYLVRIPDNFMICPQQGMSRSWKFMN